MSKSRGPLPATDPLAAMLADLLSSPGLSVSFRAVTADGPCEPRERHAAEDAAAGTVECRNTYPCGLEETLLVRRTGGHAVCRRSLRNAGSAPVRLVETALVLRNVATGGPAADDYFYHPENPRIYDVNTIPVAAKRTAAMASAGAFDEVAGTKWADPGVVSERVGASPYQPFPAVLLGNHAAARGVVHGSLSQRVFYHCHLFRHADAGVEWEMLSALKDVRHRDVAPGERLEDCWYLGTAPTDRFENLFAGYAAVLRAHLPAGWGRSAVNRHSAVWGSWNDGIFRDIDEDRLLAQADFLRDELPTVEWMQIDDGYAALSGSVGSAHGIGCAYEEGGGISRTKFPRGFRHFTDEVRRRGIKPAIWIGGFIPEKAPLARERPEWLVDYSYRVEKVSPLDVSIPEVRDYMTRALDALLTEAGFEGMKHDFWSYAFEDSHPLLARTDRSGYEWRSWWLSEIRKRLPAHGYLQTGCDIVMGGPFLGEYFTNYRYGIDVGNGNWDYVKTNFLWGAACFAAQTGDLFVPNSDSIGLFAKLPDNEALTVINYCLISRSLVEVAGWLYRTPDHPRMRWVRKALACLNNGEDVFFARYDDWARNPGPPLVWYLKSPYFSLLRDHPLLPARTVAVFNLDEAPREFSLTPADLGLPEGSYVAADPWSLETVAFERLARFELPARTSRLLTVSRTEGGPRILDAGVGIRSARTAGDAVEIETGPGPVVEITLDRPPRSAAVEGVMGDVSIERRGGAGVVTARRRKDATAITLRF